MLSSSFTANVSIIINSPKIDLKMLDAISLCVCVGLNNRVTDIYMNGIYQIALSSWIEIDSEDDVRKVIL